MSFGYQGVVCYDPVEGFHHMHGLQLKGDVIAEIERLARESADENHDGRGSTLNLTRRQNAQGEVSLIPDSFQDAAHIICLLLAEARHSAKLRFGFIVLDSLILN